MRVQVVTSLFPSPPRPFEGIFAERRWAGMVERGHDVSVLHPQPRAPLAFLGGKWAEIHAMPLREERSGFPVTRPRYLHVPRRALGNARRFARCAVSSFDPASVDVVVCDYAWPAAMLVPELAQRSVPCVVSGRGSDVLQVEAIPELGAALARCVSAAGAWCGVSRDLVATLDRLGGVAGRGHLVPNGVDTKLFTPRDKQTARQELGLAPDGALVLVVGHLIERKAPLLALDAFAEGAPREARIAFVGKGPLEADLRARIAELGLTERTTLVGERPPEELANWYGAADVLLLTSYREGRPNVVLEALASGRPVLATEAGGTAELLSDVRMLARTRDASELGKQLAALLGDLPEPGALAAGVAHLSWEKSFEALEACLRDAIELRSGALGTRVTGITGGAS